MQIGIDRWLEAYGFTGNPFASREASKENHLNEYFVAPPYFDEVLGDASSPQTTLIFAPRGGGKTAQRAMVDYHCKPKQTHENILSITYTDFTPVVEMVKKDLLQITARNHVDEILKRTIVSLCHYLTEIPSVIDCFHKMPDVDKLYLQWFISTYADYLTPRQVSKLNKEKINFLINDDEKIPANIAKYLQSKVNMPPADLLRDLSELLYALNFDAVYVLVDSVDEFDLTADDPCAAITLIEPLLADLTVMDLPKVAFKFFLPAELEKLIQSRPAIRQDRLIFRRIEWTDDVLLELLQRRLEAFSKHSSLDALCVPELRGRIEKEMIKIADGSPRSLIRLGTLLLSEHCELAVDNSYEGWLIKEKALDAAKKKFEKEIIFNWGSGQLQEDEPAKKIEKSLRDTNKYLNQVTSTFPAPIAMVCRDFNVQIAPQQKFKRLLDLFEVTMIFSAFVLIFEYVSKTSSNKEKNPKKFWAEL
ncbi:Uncharacterized protein dnl_61810 [Desulfonema limicola]|uniref:Uncharacterized protein n=1 Tax=Desulfonema limicola TaxID=45656 RepID=A0A975BE97_9BACT|nr:hypothetical protein [Desulfonema limicola]QTA83766.1 Uncharacterized protein dnl_61810 [Desulfonema limicola]